MSGDKSFKDNDKERAQDLVFEAMQATSLAHRVRFVSTALELDPDNVDALLMKADFRELKGEDRLLELQRIVQTGATQLGKKAFKDMVPHFWGFVETRPYMRARMELAEEYRRAGRLEEAVSEYTEMLALNENDNQGVRYHLLPCLLALNRLPEAHALIKQSEGECAHNVVFAWCKVLERHLAGDSAGAVAALASARKQNAHMEAYLLGFRKPPKNMPDSYAVGSREEAITFVQPLLMAWAPHTGALAKMSPLN